MRLRNRVAFVTGAAQGIGQAIALRLAEEGADIVAHVRKEDERSAATRDRILALGRRCAVVAGDVSQPPVMRSALDRAVDVLGPIDLLVNNAGIEKRVPVLDITEDDYDQVLDVNLKGLFFLSQAFAQMCRRTKRGGRIVNISSVHEDLPFPNFTPYCLSKGGLKMMMRNLAIELAPFGITVNNIAPGAIETPMNEDLVDDPGKLEPLLAQIPLKRLGRPRDVAGAVVFLASDDADYVTGTTLVVDGGLLWQYEEQ